MSATATACNESVVVKPPAHPTYDLKEVIQLALSEDAGDKGDVTCKATIPSEMEVDAHFLAKDDDIVAGIALAEMVLNEVDPSPKDMADAAHPAYILETRKTAPGLRLVDNVLIGGGRNHRLGLLDMVMIKDNHISITGGATDALKSVDWYLNGNNVQMGVEIETRILEEVNEVLEYSSKSKTTLTRIILDNMVVPLPDGDVDVSMLKEAVELIGGRFDTEASGNVTLETVHKIGQTSVTYISRDGKVERVGWI